MHVLFVHPNFPAQFGHLGERLLQEPGHRVTFASKRAKGVSGAMECLFYDLKGGATEKNHYSSRTFENNVWQSHALYEALKPRPDIRPDVVVGHSGFISTVLLRELYDAPILNYFEFYYHNKNSDLDFRPDIQPSEDDKLRSHFRNSVLLLDLNNCDRGYSPTRWQRDQMPELFRPKIDVLFDGIDTNLWKPLPRTPRRAGKIIIPESVKLVSYVARGFESIRGFDIFMKVAKRLCEMRSDVRFLVVGEDRVCYGGDNNRTGGKTYKEWVLAQDNYDLSRFAFVGRLAPDVLAQVFSITDLHLYLTVPFVLSWSLMNALACGTTVLASNTAPVQEMIQHEKNGLLVDFFDVEGFAQQANRVLNDPEQFRPLGLAGTRMIQEEYSLDVCFPRWKRMLEGEIEKR
jgi:glycosyltransferase involved in cell wall biosynthesis